MWLMSGNVIFHDKCIWLLHNLTSVDQRETSSDEEKSAAFLNYLRCLHTLWDDDFGRLFLDEMHVELGSESVGLVSISLILWDECKEFYNKKLNVTFRTCVLLQKMVHLILISFFEYKYLKTNISIE